MKINSVIVIDISSKLTLLDIEVKGRIKALKVVEFTKDRKNEVILESLQNFIKANNIRHRNAILRPTLDSLHIKRIQLPAVPDNELLEAIKWQLKEDISFDLSKAILDFSIIQRIEKDDGSKAIDIIAAIAEEQEIKQYVLLLKQLGIRCLSVSLLPSGYAKIVEKYFKHEKDKPTAVLHLSDNICFISIYKNNNLEFYRELPLSVKRLKDSLRGVLVSDKGKVDLTEDEVDEVLFNIGVPQENIVYKNKITYIQILSMLRPSLERLATELKRSLDYYGSQFHGDSVDKIFLLGSAARINNLEKFLAKELPSSIEKLSLEDKISLSSNINPSDFVENYAALGLALDYRQGINLLPYEFRTEKIERVEKVSLRWITFFVFLLFAVSFVFTRGEVLSYQKRLDNARLHLNVLSEVRDIKTKNIELNNFVVEVRNSEPPISQMFKKLNIIAPQELFIVNFSLDCRSKSGTIKGFVKMINKNPEIILSQFVGAMEQSIYFTNVNISSVERSTREGIETAEFSINYTLA